MAATVYPMNSTLETVSLIPIRFSVDMSSGISYIFPSEVIPIYLLAKVW